MKFFAAILALVGCLIFGSAKEVQLDFSRIPAEAKQELQAVIADRISGILIQKLMTKYAAPRQPVLPIEDLPDPLEIENAELDLDGLGIDGISGFVALRNGSASGLSTIIDDLVFALPLPTVTIAYDFRARSLAAEGDYEAIEVRIDEIPASGAGELNADINDLHLLVDVRATVNLLTFRLTFQSVTIDVDFASVELNLEDLVVCGEPVDWDAVNEDAKPVFDQFWAENKGEVETLVKDVLQELLKDCNVLELVGGNFDCLNLEIGAAPIASNSKNPFRSAFNYFAPIMPRLDCDSPIVNPPPTTEPPTTEPPATEPPTTETPTTPAGASHAQTGAGIFLGTLLVFGARARLV